MEGRNSPADRRLSPAAAAIIMAVVLGLATLGAIFGPTATSGGLPTLLDVTAKSNNTTASLLANFSAPGQVGRLDALNVTVSLTFDSDHQCVRNFTSSGSRSAVGCVLTVYPSSQPSRSWFNVNWTNGSTYARLLVAPGAYTVFVVAYVLQGGVGVPVPFTASERVTLLGSVPSG